MLVKIIDHKGKASWVNPAYVRAVREKGDGKSQIDVSGWATPVLVSQPMDEVAGLLSIAMERLGRSALEAAAGIESERTQREAEMIASVIVIGG